MKGHVETRKGKTGTAYRLVVPVGKDRESGAFKYIKRTIPASAHYGKKDAEKALRELIREIDSGAYVENSGETVNDVLNAWIDSVNSASEVRKKTIESYRLICDSYLRPYIGNVSLDRLTPTRIERGYAQLRKRPSKRGGTISARTVTHAHRTLSEAMRWAHLRGVIATNPCERVKTPRADRPEIRVIEPGEMQQVFDYLDDHSSWAVTPTILALTTGARRSEILGLFWSDIDLRAGTISIQRALNQLRDQSTVITPTKTSKSTRLVALTDRSIDAFKRWRRYQDKRASQLGVSVKKGDYVFSDPHESDSQIGWRPFLPSSLSQAFSRACKALNMTGASFKSLRHTHASTLLKSNIHPKVVQERLGHSTITTTLDVYSHVAPGLQAAAARAFDDAFVEDAPARQQIEKEGLK